LSYWKTFRVTFVFLLALGGTLTQLVVWGGCVLYQKKKKSGKQQLLVISDNHYGVDAKGSNPII
jgi:hypothetical protein